MSSETNFAEERQLVFAAAKNLGLNNPNSETLIAQLVNSGTPLTDVGRLTQAGLNVRLRDVASALQLTVRAPQAAAYKAPPTLDPIAKLQSFYASQRGPELDPKEKEVIRLRSEAKVRKLNSQERSTLAVLEWQPENTTPAPVPASVMVGAQTAAERYARQQKYQTALRLNRELLQLKSNEARLRGEGEHILASHVKGMIAECERKIAANGGAA